MTEVKMQRVLYGDYSRCIIEDCGARREDGVSLHQFPDKKLDRKRWQQWVDALNLSLEPSKRAEICDRHFKETDFSKPSGENVRRKLKKDAVPEKILTPSMIEKLAKAKPRDERMKQRAEKLNSSNVDPGLDPGFDNIEAQLDLEPEPLTRTFQEAGVQVNTLDLEELYAKRKRTVIHFKTDEQLTAWTGINNFKILETIVKAIQLMPDVQMNRLDITMHNLVLLVFVKLKTDLSFRCIATLFGTTPKTASTYFHKMIPLLADVMRVAVSWQSKEAIKQDLPYHFRQHGDVRAVLDCTEIAIQRSTCLHCRILSYSHYKGRETAKYLVAVSPGGVFTYISPGYVGKASDKYIFNDSEMINLFDEHDAVMVDKGFSIRQELASKNLKLVRPPTLYDEQLSRDEAKENQSIASARVHVERAIQRLKTFHILSGKLDHTLIPFLDEIVIILAGLTNLSPPILSDDRFY